jgi:hypothetical protein
VYAGWERLLPELLAEGGILAWLFRRSVVARWTRARAELVARQRVARQAQVRAKTFSSILAAEVDEDDELPPEIEDQLRQIFSGKRK